MRFLILLLWIKGGENFIQYSEKSDRRSTLRCRLCRTTVYMNRVQQMRAVRLRVTSVSGVYRRTPVTYSANEISRKFELGEEEKGGG